MTVFKSIATLILISVIGLALLNGPPADLGNGGKEAPGQQSPAVPLPSPNGPTPLLVFLTIVGVPLLGLWKRLTGSG
jgi:hypothetical protein